MWNPKNSNPTFPSISLRVWVNLVLLGQDLRNWHKPIRHRIGKAAELGARLVGSSFTAHCTVEASVIVGQNMRKGVGC